MIPLLFAAALQSEIVLQTNVIEKVSCGAGCHYKIEQLTPMVEIGDGWRKIKVKSTPYLWHHERGLEQRPPYPDSPLNSGGSTSWNYSNCKTNIFTARRKEYFSPPPSPPEEKWERNQEVFLKDGKPNSITSNGNPFEQWAVMCPKESNAGRLYIQQQHDSFLKFLKENRPKD